MKKMIFAFGLGAAITVAPLHAADRLGDAKKIPHEVEEINKKIASDTKKAKQAKLKIAASKARPGVVIAK